MLVVGCLAVVTFIFLVQVNMGTGTQIAVDYSIITQAITIEKSINYILYNFTITTNNITVCMTSFMYRFLTQYKRIGRVKSVLCKTITKLLIVLH